MMNRRCSIWSRFPNRAQCAPRTVGAWGTTRSAIRRARRSSRCTARPRAAQGFAWADERARARGIRLLAPDRPGVGESDPWRLGREADGRRLRAGADRVRRRARTRVVLGHRVLRRRSVRAARRPRARRSRPRGGDRVGRGPGRRMGVDRRLRSERPRADAARGARPGIRARDARALGVRRPARTEDVGARSPDRR